MLEYDCLVGVKGQEFLSWVKVKMMAMWEFYVMSIGEAGQAILVELQLLLAVMVVNACDVYEDMDLLRALNASVKRSLR